MNNEIDKNLYEVPYPYKIHDALNFIKSSYGDFNLDKAITFGLEFKNTPLFFLLYIYEPITV